MGSTTIAPIPCSIARTAIHVWVTVLPEPVAPTTSVCLPSLAAAERDRHRAVALVQAEQQPLATEPSLDTQGLAKVQPGRSGERAQEIQRSSPARREIGQVGTGFEVFAVPAPAAHGGEQSRDRQRERGASETPRCEHEEHESAGRPAPVQMPAAHHPGHEHAECEPDGAVDGRSQRASG